MAGAKRRRRRRRMDGEDVVVDEYRNVPTAFLSNFMQRSASSSRYAATLENNVDANDDDDDPILSTIIDFDCPKIEKVKIETLAAILDYELHEREWFVTGMINPRYFDDDFVFQDPDVRITGVRNYAEGVRRIFDGDTSRADIISTVVNAEIPNTISVTWRLSGRVNIGPWGLPIKPYVCYTDFTVDERSGLIVMQEDRFDVPGWDILLSALFPFLIGWITKAPAPEVTPRVVTMPETLADDAKSEMGGGGIFDGMMKQIGFAFAELFEGV
ncbi:hypothetical protein ACHAXA_006172 [Cyclostephanos tholiformis]|uniref:SnoaL-like domain-containing protein n=1 Tax=Cyclostephanos tholiformis TaxID=382380 RepID=A0ABD3R6H1_9STRA